MKTVREACDVGPALPVRGKFGAMFPIVGEIGVLRWRNDEAGSVHHCVSTGGQPWKYRRMLRHRGRSARALRERPEVSFNVAALHGAKRCRPGVTDEFHRPGRIRWCRLSIPSGWHGQGVDADKPDTRRTKPVIAFNDRRDVQTCPSKPGICLRNSAAVLCHQLIQLVLRQDRGLAVITCSGFGIDCLDRAPEAGSCKRDADNEGESQKRSVAPV